MKITAIVGTYRKNGVIDRAVDEILDAARSNGAEVTKIDLLDQHVEFCTNCRSCTQQEGPQRGRCPIGDDVNSILDEIERSDALVLASPMNFYRGGKGVRTIYYSFSIFLGRPRGRMTRSSFNRSHKRLTQLLSP